MPVSQNIARLRLLLSNYETSVNFSTGDWEGLTVATKTDANSQAGFAMASGYVYENAVSGDTGASAITLPAATAGSLVVHRFVAQADGGQNITFTTKSGDYYAGGTLMLTVSNVSAGQLMTRCTQTDWTQSSVSPSNGEIKTFNGTTHNTITIAMTATNNQTNIGAEIAFYCAVDGKWRVSWRGAQLGSGIVNATWAVSAA